MANIYRIVHWDYEGDGEQNVYLKLLDSDNTQVVLSYVRFPNDRNGLFDDEPRVHFSTNVELDDIRDLYLALSTGDDIARSFYSVDGGTLIMVSVFEGIATMEIVTSAGEEITSDFDPPMDDAQSVLYGLYKLLEEVK